MRDTKYARELGAVAISYEDGNEARLERLFVKEKDEEEIRFSWWRNGQMMRRPLDVPEADLMRLLIDAARQGLFTQEGLARLKAGLP